MVDRPVGGLVARPDQASLLATFTDLISTANTSEGGLLGLQCATELAAAATGAVGATFIEYSDRGGRFVVTCGDLQFTTGRPVDARARSIENLIAGPPVQEVAIRDLGRAGSELYAAGLRRMLRASALAGGVQVGALQVYFRDEESTASDLDRAWIAVLAACAAHLYADGQGLPVYDAGPNVRPAQLAVAVVGNDGIVRSWNPAAEELTGRRADTIVGGYFPYPAPHPGRALDHRTTTGSWIRIWSTRLATDAVALSMREHTSTVREEQSRDLFLTVASHELRTPVTVIRGYADTLIEHWEALDEPSRREAVFVMGQRARELARLVDRLLTAASDAAGLLDDAPGVPFDCLDALREATTDLTPDIRAAVRLDLPDELPKALGNRISMTTVVTEMVTNACKYSPSRVQVDLTAGADASTVWFRVSDRGVGIRPEHVERAFERFWQLDNADQRTYGGVGLGLYLVRRIVERQGGWVSLRPRDGGGTVAEVRLPRADAAPPLRPGSIAGREGDS
jgi:two-component system, OmpR family, phosphate regulon sensor histidine kinase PhoR